MSNKLEDLGKSMELAAQIDMIKLGALLVDTDYLRDMIEQFRKQSSFEASAAVLNPHWNPYKSRLLLVQATAMEHLYSFITGLKECQNLKDSASKHDLQLAEISKMFI